MSLSTIAPARPDIDRLLDSFLGWVDAQNHRRKVCARLDALEAAAEEASPKTAASESRRLAVRDRVVAREGLAAERLIEVVSGLCGGRPEQSSDETSLPAYVIKVAGWLVVVAWSQGAECPALARCRLRDVVDLDEA